MEGQTCCLTDRHSRLPPFNESMRKPAAVKQIPSAQNRESGILLPVMLRPPQADRESGSAFTQQGYAAEAEKENRGRFGDR